VLPQACWGRAYREINSRGLTVRSVDAPLTPEQSAQREAEARRKREQERLAREERKRNQALLDAYSSERDIDRVRDRALADIQKSLDRANERYAEAAKRQKDLSNEMEFYRRKPAPKELLDSIRDNESELRAHGSVVEAKQKDMEATRAKFDEEKRRYMELTRGRPLATSPAPATVPR
jgi:chromosome segregation ATPase